MRRWRSACPRCCACPKARRAAAARSAPSILADALEALIGAVFLDGGFDAAQAVVRRLFGEVIAGHRDRQLEPRTPRPSCRSGCRRAACAVPTYRIVATRGQAHAQTFEVECAVPALGLAERGEGRSRRIAEQEAARRMLDVLKASDRPGGPLRS